MTPMLWSAALGPLALALVAALPAPADKACRFATRAAAFNLLLALVSAAAVGYAGPLRAATFGVNGIGFGLSLDAFGAAVFPLVSFIGLVVIAYSRRYLAGNPRHAVFERLLAATLAAVVLFVLSGNLLQSWLAWIAASLTLGRLLVFFPERRAGAFAARKKHIASRLGDAALLVAMVLFYKASGSLDIATLLANPAPAGAAPLIVLAALLKSAQFPLHGWLMEVMETPTPVSALLHAGVINAGGFLVLKFSPLVAASPLALGLLLVVGAVTAIFGSLVMLPQTTVKGALAASTVAQIGFMMLEIGLGAFSAAALHLIAHSLYKAHAFLSSGGAAVESRKAATPAAPLVSALLALVAPALVAGYVLIGGEGAQQPGVFALGAIFALGLAPMFAEAAAKRAGPLTVLGLAALAAVSLAAYFALQTAVAFAFSSALAAPPRASAADWTIAGVVVAAFAALSALQALLPRLAARPEWRWMRIHVANGFYVNTLFNRALMKLWPAGPAPRIS